MSTPFHIQPEWYFLFAYTILRSVPSNLGVIALGMSVLLLLVIPLLSKNEFNSYNSRFGYANKVTFWLFVLDFVSLTWLGTVSPDEPWLISLCQVLSSMYFCLLFVIIVPWWNSTLF